MWKFSCDMRLHCACHLPGSVAS